MHIPIAFRTWIFGVPRTQHRLFIPTSVQRKFVNEFLVARLVQETVLAKSIVTCVTFAKARFSVTRKGMLVLANVKGVRITPYTAANVMTANSIIRWQSSQ